MVWSEKGKKNCVKRRFLRFFFLAGGEAGEALAASVEAAVQLETVEARRETIGAYTSAIEGTALGMISGGVLATLGSVAGSGSRIDERVVGTGKKGAASILVAGPPSCGMLRSGMCGAWQWLRTVSARPRMLSSSTSLSACEGRKHRGEVCAKAQNGNGSGPVFSITYFS